jgi:tetratricopeptide (TPR) repeat protein
MANKSTPGEIIHSEHKPHRLRTKLAYIALPVVILLAGIGVSYAIVVQNSNADTDADTAEDGGVLPGMLGLGNGDIVDRAYRQAETLSAQGKYDEAKQLLLDAITSNADIPSAKGYRYLSGIAINQKANDDALLYSQKSFELDQRSDTAELVAMAAEAKGDKPLAKEYYQKALDKLGSYDKDDEQTAATATRYAAKIEELK